VGTGWSATTEETTRDGNGAFPGRRLSLHPRGLPVLRRRGRRARVRDRARPPAAPRMKQYKVVNGVVAAEGAPKKVVDVPAFFERQRLTTDQTFPVLLQPKVACGPPSRQGAGHLMRQALFKVQLPGRIVGIRRSPDFHVSADWRVPGTDEKNGMKAAVLVPDGATKSPRIVAGTGEVEPYVRVSPHTAQAFTNAPRGTRSFPPPIPHCEPVCDSWRAGILPDLNPKPASEPFRSPVRIRALPYAVSRASFP